MAYCIYSSVLYVDLHSDDEQLLVDSDFSLVLNIQYLAYSNLEREFIYLFYVFT